MLSGGYVGGTRWGIGVSRLKSKFLSSDDERAHHTIRLMCAGSAGRMVTCASCS